MAILKDLLVTGAARFKGKIYGNLAGNADTATTITGNINQSQVTGLNDELTGLNSAITDQKAQLSAHEKKQADGNSGTGWGHVILSDSTTSTSSTSAGIAATPKAINTVANNLTAHVAEAAELYIYVGDENLGTAPTKDADTLNGKTVAEIIAAANGQGTTVPAGTVGYSDSSAATGATVTLTDYATGSAIFPRTSIANVTGLQTKLDTIPSNPVTFVTSSSTPASSYQKLGTI